MSELRHGNDILNPVVVINPVDDTKITPQNTWSAEQIATLMPFGHDDFIDVDTYDKNIKGWCNNLSGILPKNITAGWFENEYVNSSTINQKIITYDKEIFVRSMFGGVWSDWKEIVNTSMFSNPNLLDNGWFTVNQRGTKSSGDNYGFDRYRGTYTIKDGLPSFETKQYIIQKLEPNLKNELDNKTLTFSVMLSDGTIYSGCAVYNKNAWTSFFLEGDVIYLQTNDAGNLAITAHDSITIKAVKLELGSVSTLHLDTAPNYATELMKCKRYYQRIIGSNMYFSFVAGTNSSAVYFPFLLETEMRANPIINCSVMPYIGEVSSGSTQATNQVTELTCSTKDFRLLEMKATTTNTVPNGVAKIYLKDSNTTIEFSADL